MEAEMVCLLLERLELSRGFNNLEKKTNRPHTSKITLLPSKHVIQNLTTAKKSVLGPNEQNAISSLLHQAPSARQQTRETSQKRTTSAMRKKPVSAKQSARKMQLESKKEQPTPESNFGKIKEAVDEHKERLMRIFAYYCSFGEPLNTNMLRSSKFIKLLKDAKLL